MPVTCPALASGDAFLSSLLSHIDCQGRTLGLAGYEALATSTSPIGLALTGLLVIFVALFGIRMALGETPTLRDIVMAVVKIGIMLTLATSWPAYQIVVYDVVVDGPGQLAASMGASSGTGDLIGRLQAADKAIIRLTSLGTGREEFAALPLPPGSPVGEAPQRFPIADNPAFGWGRVLFLSSTLAAFAVIRLTAGVLLALAPVFAGLLLFDITRGLFVGWARALVFTFLASIAVSTVLGVELTLLEPWLRETISQRRAQAVTANAPVELLVLCLGFAVALAGSLGLLLRLAFMVHVPYQKILAGLDRLRPTEMPVNGAQNPANPWDRPASERPPSRALVIADSIAAAQRRESARPLSSQAGSLASPSRQRAAGVSEDLIIPTFGPVSRRTRPRTSLGARLRDGRS